MIVTLVRLVFHDISCIGLGSVQGGKVTVPAQSALIFHN